MSDVFISYSRLDKAFVGQLRDALAAQQQDVWIDWESIPPSQVWWKEIRKGIATANNFVVVMSPNSMGSPICQMEIEYARQLGKRIIPVMHMDFERGAAIRAIADRLAAIDQTSTRDLWANRQPHTLLDENTEHLRQINYFYFRPDDDFAARFAALIEVIRTDYAHKEQHTTLELRALEWDRRGRNASFLLLDDELTGAQTWLSQAEGKVPPPTDLQRAYIQVSEKRTRQLRNIRRASIIASALAVVAMVFAVVASVVGVRATNSANEAATQVADANDALTAVPPTLTQVSQLVADGEARAESLRLANEALNVLNDPNTSIEIATMLAIRALNTAHTLPAENVLARTLGSLQTRTIFSGNAGFSAVGYLPRERVVGANIIGSFYIYDLQSGEQLHHIENAHRGAIRSVAISPDQSFFVTASEDMTARVWDADTMELLGILSGHTDILSAVAVSPDSRLIATGGRDGTIRVWVAETGALRQEWSIVSERQDAIDGLAFSQQDGTLFSVGSNDYSYRWNPETGEQLARYDSDTGYSVAISPDGETLAIAALFPREGIHIWDLNRAEPQLDLLLSTIGPSAQIAFSADGRYLALTSGLNIELWDVDAAERVRLLRGHRGLVFSIAFSPNGETILSGGNNAMMRLWSVEPDGAFNHPLVQPFGAFGTLFADDGQRLYTWGAGDIRIWSLPELRLERIIDINLNSLVILDDAYIIGDFQGQLTRLNRETGAVEWIVQAHTTALNHLVHSEDERLLLTATSGYSDSDTLVKLWDAETGALLQIMEGHSEWIQGIGLHPHNGTAVSQSSDDTLREWDVATGQQSRQIDVSGFGPLIYGPGGNVLYASTTNYDIDVYDSETLTVRTTLSGHAAQLLSLAVSPDGLLLASGDYDGIIRLWNTQTGEVLRSFQAHLDGVTALMFSPDGRFVASSGFDERAAVWFIDTQDMIDYACERLQLDLYREERVRFGVTDDEPTCPQFAGE